MFCQFREICAAEPSTGGPPSHAPGSAPAPSPARSRLPEDQDLAEQLALRADAMHAATCAAPEIAVLVHLQPVAIAGLHLVEDLPARQRPAVGGEVEGTDVLPRRVLYLAPRLGDIEAALVEREDEPVRPVEVVR